MASLNLTFDNITNADLLVGDASVVGDWNTFFDLPTYGTPFSAVTISGNTVQLFGGSNIIIKEMLFDQPDGYGIHLISVDDSVGSIVEIQYDAFGKDQNLGCPNLMSVSFPNVTDLGDWAFYYCDSLTLLSFPSLITANYGSFGNLSIQTINLQSLVTAGENCFQNCTSLTTINLPSLTSAGNNCFAGWTALTTVDLPLLTTAGDYCFTGCISLTTINLPSLTSAGNNCFYPCTALTTIYLPSCTDLGGTVGDDYVFNGINGNTITLTIPPVLMTCDSGSPDGDIQYLQANNTVRIIVNDPNALNLSFDSIANADSLVGDASNVSDWNTFFDLPTNGTPFSAVTISGNTVQLFGGSNITIIDNKFEDVDSLLSVIDGVGCIISVGNSSFYECSFLSDIKFPSITGTGEYTFSYCSIISLTSENLPNLTYIGLESFSYCIPLTTINLPNLASVGGRCFVGCTSLTTINFSSCTNLGGTVGDDQVFDTISGNTITLTIPSELMTCNSGSPDGDIQYLQANNTVTIIEVTPTPTPTPTPSPTSSIITTPTPSVTPTNTPSPTFIPYSGVAVNQYYVYDIAILGDFSGGTAPAGSTVPHPIMIGNDGIPYAQMNAVQIGGFGGLNN